MNSDSLILPMLCWNHQHHWVSRVSCSYAVLNTLKMNKCTGILSKVSLNGQRKLPHYTALESTLCLSLELYYESTKLSENMASLRMLTEPPILGWQMCTFCSLSGCLVFLPMTHPHTTKISHNTQGEWLAAGNVKLLCHIQSKLEGLFFVCVCMCLCTV